MVAEMCHTFEPSDLARTLSRENSKGEGCPICQSFPTRPLLKHVKVGGGQFNKSTAQVHVQSGNYDYDALNSGPSRCPDESRSVTQAGVQPLHLTHCNLRLLSSSDSPASASQRQDLTLSPRLECSGAITARCSLDLLGSSDPPTSATCTPNNLRKFHNCPGCRDSICKTVMMLFILRQEPLEILASSSPVALASPSAGTTGVSHSSWPLVTFKDRTGQEKLTRMSPAFESLQLWLWKVLSSMFYREASQPGQSNSEILINIITM
ncbi:hypothetical protein AAY473_011373 [Plecturocebus cupreus]